MKHRFLISTACLAIAAPAWAQTTPASPDPAASAAPQASANPSNTSAVPPAISPAPAEDGAVAARAAPAAPDTGPISSDSVGKDIVVTGSRIRGVAPVGSQVISVGAEQIARAPTATVTDFLRKVPQIEGFGVDASSNVQQGTGGTNTTRGSAINLRGLGTQATLTLLDGDRMASSGVNGTYVDPTAIPSIAIERIEVEADGASAVYGSDAVAGVVNFILRKDYDGVMAQARNGTADGYWLWQVGAIAGKRWDTGGFQISYQHQKHDNLNGDERDYYLNDLTAFGGSDYRNTDCNPGNIVLNGTRYAIPQGGVTAANRGDLVAGTENRCENLSHTDILPREERDSVVASFHQKLADGLTMKVEGLYSNRNYLALGIQQGSSSNIVSLTVPNTNAYFVSPPGTAPKSETVEYDFTPELGDIRQYGYTKDIHISGGLDYDISSHWRASVEGFWGQDKSNQNAQRVNSTSLTTALASSNPATAFNPFGGGNSDAVLASIFNGVFNPYATSLIDGGTAQVNGDLFHIGGGMVRVAVGAEMVNYGLHTGSNIGTIGSAVLTTAYQSRAQKSVFGELYVPIFGPDNARPGLEKLELSIAGRYDHYDDVGNTSNPKIGVNWSPFRGLTFKGSYGTSFRAPALQDLPLIRAGSGLAVVTWLDPTSPTGSSTGLSLNAGNPDLTPETATTYTFTAQVEPPSIPGLSLSATYYSIKYENNIISPPRTSTSLLDPNYAFAVTRNPSDALIQSYLNEGFTIAGIRPATVAFFYNGQAANSGSIYTNGIDFDFNYDRETPIGQLTFGFVGTYLMHYKVAVTKVAPELEQRGNINYPVDFRFQASAGWARDGLSAEVTANYVNGYSNNLLTPNENIGSWTTFDLHLGYDFQSDSKVLHGLGISIDASNLFDKNPPFVNIQGGYDPGEASALGRLVAFTVTKKF